jgi:hypothetical protein
MLTKIDLTKCYKKGVRFDAHTLFNHGYYTINFLEHVLESKLLL